MNKPKLHAVPDSEMVGGVDSWIQPEDLPINTFINPSKFLNRWWKFDPEAISLIPMPQQPIEQTVVSYVGLPVLNHIHRKWLMENQAEIPEEYQQYKHIYFPSDQYLYCDPAKVSEAFRFIYRITFKDNQWIEEQVCWGFIPTSNKERLIMVR